MILENVVNILFGFVTMYVCVCAVCCVYIPESIEGDNATTAEN